MDPSMGIVDPCPQALEGFPAHLFLTLINTLMAAKCPLGSPQTYPEDYGPKLAEGDEFDFVIVGGGTSGAVLANRLTENGKWRVLVLENGGYPSATSDVPGLVFNLQGSPEDYQYETEPSDTSCLGFKNKRCRWPRGKLLGGCSSINAMIYLRGHKRDYDQWAEMGNPGWDWDSVLPHFKALEKVLAPHLVNSSQYGRDGFQTLSWYDSGQPIKDAFKEAGRELGYPSLQEENPLKPLGYLETLMSIDGTRQNSAKAFLGKIKERRNLHVAVNSMVTKIVLDATTKTTKGVEVRIGGKTVTILATKEVILSGGVINSAQLLMLSGIGPKEHLESLGIPTIHNLPVGENLQDHTMFTGNFFTLTNDAVASQSQDDDIDKLYNFFRHRKGDLNKIFVTNLIAFINSRAKDEYPNLQLMHVAFKPYDGYLLQAMTGAFGFEADTIGRMMEVDVGVPRASIYPVVVNPKSRGRVLLRSKDVTEKPVIHSGYFTDEDDEDMKVTLEGIRYVEKLLQTDAMSKFKPKLVDLKIPGCNQFKFQSDEYWRCMIRHMTTTMYHPVGTCKMGPEGDETSVVDPRLRVHGVRNLRVVDASIMPKIVSVNTAAASMMIGHKGGAMIIEDWSARHDEF